LCNNQYILAAGKHAWWWNEEVDEAVTEKKTKYGKWKK